MRPEDVSKEKYTNWLFEQARIDLGGRPAEIGMTTPRVSKGMKGMPEPQAPIARSTTAPPRIGRGLLILLREYLAGGFRYGTAEPLLEYITNLQYFLDLPDNNPFKKAILDLIAKSQTRGRAPSMLELFTVIMRDLQPGKFGAFGRFILGGRLGDNLQALTRFFERLQRQFNVNDPSNDALRKALEKLFGRRGPGTIDDADFLVTLLRRLGIGDLNDIEALARRITRRINNLPDGSEGRINQGLIDIYQNFLRDLRGDMLVTIEVRNASGDLEEQTINLIDYLALLSQNGDISDIGSLMTLLRTQIGTRYQEMFAQMREFLIRNGVSRKDAREALRTLIGSAEEMNGRFDDIFRLLLERIMRILSQNPGGRDPIISPF